MDAGRNVEVFRPIQRTCKPESRLQRNLKPVGLDCINDDLAGSGRAVATTLACKSIHSLAEERTYSVISNSEGLPGAEHSRKYDRQLSEARPIGIPATLEALAATTVCAPSKILWAALRVLPHAMQMPAWSLSAERSIPRFERPIKGGFRKHDLEQGSHMARMGSIQRQVIAPPFAIACSR